MTLLPSRRAFLMTGASAAACGMLSGRAAAQSAVLSTSNGFRLLRATSKGYDGSIPGPLLRVRQGDELSIRLVNELPQPTAIHWHGIRVPNTMDGIPDLTQSKIEPGATFDCRFKTIDAGTFWYHAPSTLGGPMARDLYGVLIVEEKAPVQIDREIVLVFDDRPRATETFNTKSNERLRFRLLNASKARLLSLRFDRHAIRVMAIDGQPAEPFLAHESHVSLGPGNRIDLFLDAGLEPGASASIFLDDQKAEKEVARLVYDAGEKRRASPLPDPRSLPANPLPERIDMRNAFRAEAPLHAIASQKQIWAPVAPPLTQFDSPFFSVTRGRPVVLAFPNQTDEAYGVHVHGHHVRLLDNFDDGWKPFWLDTIMTGPRRTTRVAFVADNPGKWLLHAQKLGDPETALAAWFEVT